MRSLASLLLAGGLLAAGMPAVAKSSKLIEYPYKVTWSAAVRLIRVDRGYEITDQDAETGYLLFVYPGSGAAKECAGALELVTLEAPDDRARLKAQLQIAHQPRYIEVQFLDELEQKLRAEQGPPPPPKRRKRPDKDAPPKNKEAPPQK